MIAQRDGQLNHDRIARGQQWRSLLQANAMVGVLILLVGVSALVPRFMTPENLVNIVTQSAIPAVVALGMTFALIAGKFDLSMGSLVSLSGVLAIGLQPSLGLGGALVATMLISLAIGAVNGILVGYLDADALIVTLGMLSVLGAAALIYSGGVDLTSNSTAFAAIGQSHWASVPVLIVYAIVLIGMGHVVLRYTVYGRHLYLIGDNRNAARVAGVNVRATTASVFLVSAGLAGIGGILLTSWVATASPVAGTGWELNALAAAVLGGSGLYGAEGRAANALVGALIFSIIGNLIVLLHLSVVYQEILEGLVIIAAVAIRRGGVR